MGYRYKKKRYRLKPFPILIALLIVVILILFAIFIIKKGANSSNSTSSSSSVDNRSSVMESSLNLSSDTSENNSIAESSSKVSSTVSKPSSSASKPSSTLTSDTETTISKSAWNLVLLNRDNSISKDMQMQKKQFGSQWIDSRVAPAYQNMCDAAKAEGITLFLRSGYRSISTQRVNYEADISRNINKGYTREQAILETEKYYARPGQSEHHTGLALDILSAEYQRDVYTLSEKFADTDAYKWLIKNCANYGFILRYPADKVDVTKINYEPWHYRYVGIQHAKYIMENNLSLEEYLK